MIQRPSIDHGLLSPNGRISKRARAAALAREGARLFPPGSMVPAPKSAAEEAKEKAETLRRSAANLRDLAARGMSPRKFTKEATRLEAAAAAIEQGVPHAL